MSVYPTADLRAAIQKIRSDMGTETPGIPYDNQEQALLAAAAWLDEVATALEAGDPDDNLGFGEPSAARRVAAAYMSGSADD